MTLNDRVWRIIDRFLIAIIVVFAALHFVRLAADFPLDKWWEVAAFTDEGWWNIAAVNVIQTGHWAIAGDLNQAIGAPVLPAIMLPAFRAAGAGLVTARVVESIFFLLVSLVAYLLALRLEGRRFALAVTALFVVSYYEFAFSRIALLENPMLFFALLALYTVTCWNEKPVLRGVAIGFLVAAAFLTKMSAVFVLVPIAYLLYERSRSRFRFALSLLAALVAAAITMSIYAVFVSFYYASDFRSFMQNQPHLSFGASAFKRLPWELLRSTAHGQYMEPVIYPLALLGTLCYLLSRRGALRRPLFVVSFLWLVSYLGYLAMRSYCPPRYYAVLYWPIICLLLLSIKALFDTNRRIAFGVAGIVCLCGFYNAYCVADYLVHPRYSMLSMAHDVHDRVLKGNRGNILLGSMANTVSLENYVPSINDRYGSKPLAWKLDAYCPAYYINSGDEPGSWHYWAQLEARRVVESRYSLELDAHYVVFAAGRPEDNVYLYKLHRKTSACE